MLMFSVWVCASCVTVASPPSTPKSSQASDDQTSSVAHQQISNVIWLSSCFSVCI